MATDTSVYIGLMSGTSVDAVDAVLAEFSNKQLSIHANCSIGIDDKLRNSIIRLNQCSHDEIDLMCVVEHQLTQHYAQAVNQLLAQSRYNKYMINAIGMHGQTIRHRPDKHYSLQLGNPALLAELTCIDVISDFRSRDIAAGGQGAPLTPLFHSWLWRDNQKKAVLNLGGFANITLLPEDSNKSVIGFDTGPANILLDGWIRQHNDIPYDDKGLWAASGICNIQLLKRLQTHVFFTKDPPKSTGRDDFNLDWLCEQLQGMDLAPEDVQATLLELTTSSISNQLIQHGYDRCKLIVCGGGCYNSAMMSRLDKLLPNSHIITSDQLGIAPEHIEATAFAWLAMRRLHGETGNLPSVTKAKGERILGAHYKYE